MVARFGADRRVRADGVVFRPRGETAMRPNRAAVLLLTIALTSFAPLAPFAAPLAAIDGALDADDFYPPHGRIGFVGGGLVADAGLVAPDGMAIAWYRDNGAEVTWRQVPPEISPATSCSFTPPLATEARYRDGLFDGAGRLVLVGTATFPGLGDLIFVVRYLYPDCTLDPAFSDDGYFTFDLADDLSGLRVRTQTVYVNQLPAERLVVAGDRQMGGGEVDTLVLRLRGDGELDPTFDGNGWNSYDFDDEAQFLADFVVDGEERIVLGLNLDPFSADSDYVIGRLLTDGALDPTLDGDGWWRVGFDNDAAEQLGAMEVAANGDVIFGGTTDSGAERRIFVTRLNGFLQGASFGSAGDLSAVTSAVLQGDRKLILAGWSNGFDGDFDVFAFRVLVPPTGQPAVDTTFGSGGEPDPLTYFSFEGVPGGTDAAYGIGLVGGEAGALRRGERRGSAGDVHRAVGERVHLRGRVRERGDRRLVGGRGARRVENRVQARDSTDPPRSFEV